MFPVLFDYVAALLRAGVDADNLYADIASGSRATRPELDRALASANRVGDQLVITRLDRLGRSVLHLVTLGATLQQRGVGLRVLEQGIDAGRPEGRAMFGMLSVLAEFQRELIIANTRDGLAAARARGRTGGRRPRLTPAQASLAQQLYDGHWDRRGAGRPRKAARPSAVCWSLAPTGLLSQERSERGRGGPQGEVWRVSR
ncbi:recombinase family protein (plasmid) [Leifsonia sp. ZF2019]|nr:recombinase family protein [Leifsonia sp. ZF2019]